MHKPKKCKFCGKDVVPKNQFIPKEHYLVDCLWIKENANEDVLKKLKETSSEEDIVNMFDVALKSTIWELLSHIRGSIKCDHQDCINSKKTYKSEHNLRIHKNFTHGAPKFNKIKIKCKMPGCEDKAPFQSAQAFNSHLHAHPEITCAQYAERFETNEWVQCQICGKYYYRTLNEQRKNLNTACSKECYHVIRSNIAYKSLESYKKQTGYNSPGANPENKKKAADTLEERTGYRHNWSNPETQEKILSNENYINRKTKFKKGWFVSKKTGAQEHFDSSYEYVRFLQLDEDANVLYWHKNKSQKINYTKWDHKNECWKEAKTIPDIFIVYVDSHIEIEELKGEETLNSCLKADAIAKFCKENNITFKYLTHDSIMINDCWISIHKKFTKEYKAQDWRKEK